MSKRPTKKTDRRTQAAPQRRMDTLLQDIDRVISREKPYDSKDKKKTKKK